MFQIGDVQHWVCQGCGNCCIPHFSFGGVTGAFGDSAVTSVLDMEKRGREELGFALAILDRGKSMSEAMPLFFLKKIPCLLPSLCVSSYACGVWKIKYPLILVMPFFIYSF